LRQRPAYDWHLSCAQEVFIMLVINVQEPALDLAGLLQHMESGDEVVLARAGRLVARLAPYEPAPRKQMKPGAMAGQIRMADDFDAPLDDLFGQGPVEPAA
jgi:antitoxin (DNA-binding transcriptional repressor) of toxin-antitoxin stability system